MAADEALCLLGTMVGRTRIAAELDDAKRIAELCAYLPLAVSIAAERAASSPHLPLSDLVEELSEEKRRLDALSETDLGSLAVRASFTGSYRALPRNAARLFRFIGLHPGPDISLYVVAALMDTTVIEARKVSRVLLRASLLEESVRDRYTLHDLLRIYSMECADAEESEYDRRLAVDRMFTWYLTTADTAAGILVPHRRRPPITAEPRVPGVLDHATFQEAADWFEVERLNLLAAISHGATLIDPSIAWKLASCMWVFFDLRKHWIDWLSCTQLGLTVACKTRDLLGQALMLNSLGLAHRDLGKFNEALDYYQRAIQIFVQIENQSGEALGRLGLGTTRRRLRHPEEALKQYKSALEIFRTAADRWGEVETSNNLGSALHELGRFDAAQAMWLNALQGFRELGDRWGEGEALNNLGAASHQRSDLKGAREYWLSALKIFRELGDHWNEGGALERLGVVSYEMGKMDTAKHFLSEARSVFNNLGDPRVALVESRLNLISRASSDLGPLDWPAPTI